MSLPASATHRAREGATQAAHEAKPWIERLSRAGYAAKGAVYLLVGLLAAQAALGVGGDTTDTRGVLDHTIQAPFGQVLLALITVGLFGYTLWRFLQAGLDTDDEGDDCRGWVTRASSVVGGLIYGSLALFALRLLVGSADTSAGSDQRMQDRTAWLLAQPFGQWLVGIAGLVVVGVGLYQFWRAYKVDFVKHLRKAELSGQLYQTVVLIGRLGYAARGVVLGLTGAFLLLAAVEAEPGEARGLAGALATLAAQPYGSLLLGVVAAGLMAYGAFMFVQARWRHVRVA